MSAVKFDRQDELDELVAKLFLDTRYKLSKKELLELIFEIGKEDYDRLVENVKANKSRLTHTTDQRKKFIQKFCGFIELEEDEEDEFDPKSIWNTNMEE